MKVSILVPVYGVEKYIEKCAVSLFEQSYDDIEYIFVDDCSPDDSIGKLKEVLGRYPQREPQVRIIRHEENRGLGAARKTALAASTGDFVINVDSDDYLLPLSVERMVVEQRKTGADIVSGTYNTLTPEGILREKDVRELSKEMVLKFILIQNTITYNIWARLIRKSVYTDNDIDSIEGINMAEDYCLTPRLIHASSSLAYVHESVYVYRLDSSSGIFHDRMKPQHVISFLKANETVCQYICSHDKNGDYATALSIGMLNAYYQAFNAGFSRKQIISYCTYAPHGLFAVCHLLFAYKPTKKLLRFFYLSIKWIYKKYHLLMPVG